MAGKKKKKRKTPTNSTRSNKEVGDDEDDDEEEDDDEAQMDVAQTQDLAKTEKKKGNSEFHNANYIAALGCYTKAMALCGNSPHDPYLLVSIVGNRAITHLRLKEFNKCMEDCNVALRVDPKYLNAYICRAFCYLALQNFDKTFEDFDAGSKLHPNDQELQQNLQRAKQAITQLKKEASKAKKKQDRIREMDGQF